MEGWPLIAVLLLGSCTLADPSVAALAGVVTLTPAAYTVAADGVSALKLVGTLRGDTQDTVSITFTASDGTFASGTAQTATIKEIADSATTYLISTLTTHLVVITASAKGLTVSDTVRFVPAFPSGLLLTPDRVTAPADGVTAINVTVQLLRPAGLGIPSMNTHIMLSATDLATQLEIPELRRTGLSNASGVATFTINNNVSQGVRLIAKTLDGPTVADTILVKFGS